MTTNYWCIDPVDGNDTAADAARTIKGSTRFTTQVEAQLTPWKTFAPIMAGSLPAIAGNTNYFLFKRGTILVENLTGGPTGGVATPVFYLPYGPVSLGAFWFLDGSLDGTQLKPAFNLVGKEYVTIEDLDVYGGYGNANLQFLGNGSHVPDHITLRRIHSHHSLGAVAQGVRIGDPGVASGVLLPSWGSLYCEDVVTDNTMGGGIDIVGGCSSAHFVRPITDETNLHVDGGGLIDNNHWGFHAQPTVIKPIFTRIGIAGTFVYTTTLAAGQGNPVQVDFASSTVGLFRAFTRVDANWAAPGVGEWAMGSGGSALVMHINLGEDVGAATVAVAPGKIIRLALNTCKDILVENGRFSGDRKPLASTEDGVGAGFDTFVETSEFRNSEMVDNGGNGCAVNNCGPGCKVTTCAIERNGGDGIQANRGIGTITLEKNTLKDNGATSIQLTDIGTIGLVGANAILRGNLCLGSVTALGVGGASAGWTEDENVIDTGVLTPGFVAYTVAADPTIDNDEGLPIPVSKPAGGSTSGEATDYRGVPRPGFDPQAGAFIFIPPSPTTRSAAFAT